MPHTISRRFFFALTGAALAAPKMSCGAVEMPVVLDHILLGCSDLDRGIDFVEKHTGVRAAFGGVHPGRGTRNALLSLGEKHYLEIIAPDPQQSAAPDHYALQKLSEPRLVGWAAHPGDLNQFAIRLRDTGLAFDGPHAGSRKRPDGRLLQWKTLNLKDDRGGLLPFFIEWSADTVHPSADAPSGCKFVRFALSTPVDAELNRICTQLDLDVPVEQGEKPHLYARIVGPDGGVMQVAS
ncbi:MAG: VOC family protein [Candidatus Acidiferrum sp.]